MAKKKLGYGLKCDYYDKVFSTQELLLADIIESGMDPDYFITIDGIKTSTKATDLIVL